MCVLYLENTVLNFTCGSFVLERGTIERAWFSEGGREREKSGKSRALTGPCYRPRGHPRSIRTKRYKLALPTR